MNFDDYEQLPTPSVATNMIAGAAAGVLEHCVMYPMDSIKVNHRSVPENVSKFLRLFFILKWTGCRCFVGVEVIRVFWIIRGFFESKFADKCIDKRDKILTRNGR